ncbi:hypothetical protein KQX54_003045 [Cotesia glomerata]|uniref:Uncharacterized protein n=1 Tax=Cotesia glomerata TaxID=32391 RepID=A0AAV7IL15_COTGL|nr:hypothetical protein KQX54_003045 [Cotesia glomerata]
MYILNYVNDYDEEQSKLRWAIHDSKTELVHQMIKNNAKLKNHVLHISARLGNIAILKHYILAGIDVNKRGLRKDKGFTPLQRAVSRNQFEAVKLLIEAGAKVNPEFVNLRVCKENCSILNLAVSSGPNLAILKLLLGNNANANQSCGKCYSPLVKAIHDHQEEIVKVLLEAGADVNLRCNDADDEITPLHMAVKQNQTEIVRILLAKNANINSVTTYRRETVLHSAIQVFVGPKVVKCVLNAGIDVNLVDCNNRTVLELAVTKNTKSTEVIKEHLVKMKAAGLFLGDKNLKAIDGKDFEEFFELCCKEVEVMKNLKIKHTIVTVYDLMIKKEQDTALRIKFSENCGASHNVTLENWTTDFLRRTGQSLGFIKVNDKTTKK